MSQNNLKSNATVTKPLKPYKILFAVSKMPLLFDFPHLSVFLDLATIMLFVSIEK